MHKKMLDDIKPISKSSAPVKKIIVSKTAPKSTPPPTINLPREFPFIPREPKSGSKTIMWYIAALAIVGCLLSLSYLFEKATVAIVPKTVPIVLDDSDYFTARKDSSNEDEISYTVMTLKGTESIKLPSTESKNVSEKARGTVILYNAYSTSPYALVKNTRLATSAGAIYRLDSAVLIPGYKKQNSEIIPGSATAGITADVAGPGGNIETADFSLPGLAGTPQASKIYARTKTAITGGASGKLYVLSDEAAESAKDTLSKKLKDSLIAKTKVQIPNGYVFYESALKFTQDDDLSVPYSKDPDVPIAMSGSITAYLIKEETLIRALAGRFVTGYQGEPLEVIPKLESLALVPQTPVDISATEFQFALSGSALLKSIINEDEIKSAVVGQKKKDFENILKGIPSVESAIVTIHPFWKRSFPDNIKRIQITIENK